MKNIFYAIVIASVFITSCSNDKPMDPFLVKKYNIGLLTDSTTVKDLDAVFSNDSVVKYVSGDEFAGTVNVIEIFDKTGKKLLDLSPKEALDSTSVISSVRINDERYRTEKNISTLSTFKDIKDNYKISKVDNLINTVVVSVNEINASFTIDKKELPSSLRFDMDATIDPIQIPEKAKIKYFMIHW
ncbi:hypothetical protein BWZ20_12465 [Winogradskyella sp. J14-2]|uniref:hypothetical protein n=1 Tax=Winogradskyella sp. J14-2 TaxID=1936080 RepID=UPI000972893B|nr:hypothetical protein [Winogradskyella sp. J14-2]APY09065.1 hypothetical protein BWZ20_12465 [Winogradskyella sp. J14-2]